LTGSHRGTSDGWRGVLADDFTVSRVRALTSAITTYLFRSEALNTILVGFDTRFMSDYLASEVAGEIVAHGGRVHICSRPVPTPVISHAVRSGGYALGMMITASHNPPRYNGLKLRLPDGSPPPDSVLDEIESYLGVGSEAPRDRLSGSGVTRVDPIPSYVRAIQGLLGLASNRRGVTVAVDAMHGATAGLLSRILEPSGYSVVQVRSNRDPLFGGTTPEPLPSRLAPLQRAVVARRCDLGVAHDGDGDRIVAFVPPARWLLASDLGLILAYYLAIYRNVPGQVVATVAGSTRLQTLAISLGRHYREVPIGFRHAAESMKLVPTLIACEENGGIGLGMHMPDRDGTAVATLLCEAMKARGLTRLISEVESIVGPAVAKRVDIAVGIQPEAVIERVSRTTPDCLAGSKVISRTDIDGLKLALRGGGWLLVRASGTESAVRVYAESASEVRTQEILAAGRSMVEAASARSDKL
jgi:phosphomannomutase